MKDAPAGSEILTQEVFGPVLHVVRYASDRLDSVNDPEVRRITAGIVRAIDRAVHSL